MQSWYRCDLFATAAADFRGVNDRRVAVTRCHFTSSCCSKSHRSFTLVFLPTRSLAPVCKLLNLTQHTRWRHRPFVTGPSLFAPQDASTGLYHNDGAFTGLLHTRCARTARGEMKNIGDDDYYNRNHDGSIVNKFGAIRRLPLPLKWDLVSNALNIFLGCDRAVDSRS